MTFRIEDGVPWINDRSFRWASVVRVEDLGGGTFDVHNRGFHLTFEKGCKLSIQWGSFSYCQDYPSFDSDRTWNEVSPNAEIALITEDGLQDCWGHEDTVCGFCTPEFVLNIIDVLASPSGTDPVEDVRAYMRRAAGIIDVEEVKGEIGA